MVGSTARVPQISVLTVWATVAFATASVAWAQATNLDAAKKEGKVVIYGTIVPQVMTLIEKGFEGKYGLKIEYWRADATKVIDRVLTEWRAGKPGFDIVIGARGALLLGKEENIFAKFVPTNTANFPAKFKDADGKLTAWRVTPVGVLYNTELVKAADVPKSLDDLLDAKWQGKISMPDPSRHASTAQYLWNQNQVKGEMVGIVRGLATNLCCWSLIPPFRAPLSEAKVWWGSPTFSMPGKLKGRSISLPLTRSSPIRATRP
jgi:iron(III) transport system substrate-binding protein